MIIKVIEISDELKAVRAELKQWAASDEGSAAAMELLSEINRATSELRAARRIDEATLERPVTL